MKRWEISAAVKKMNSAERIAFYTERDEATGCWNWLGHLAKVGHQYGRIRVGGKAYLAHRFSWLTHIKSSTRRGQ